jgi:RHS repeat-associated protein
VRWNSEAPNFGAPNSFVFAKVEENLYFGSKPLKVNGGVNISADRLGSVRSGKDYFPYGQENPATTAGDKEKYATYKHDAATDLSYADQRYYATGAGRFMTSDMSDANVDLGDPTSLNTYAYVNGDPVNFYDPSGQGFFSTIAWPFKKIGQVIFGPAFFAPTLNGPPIPPAVGAAIALYAAPPKVPIHIATLKNATNDQQKKFGDAFKDAGERLRDRPDCLKMFGSSAISRLERANWSMGAVFTDPNSADAAGESTFAGTRSQNNSITINLLGRFFRMVDQQKVLDEQGRPGLLSTDWRIDNRLNQDENRSLVLLHELGHLMGVLGDDRISGEGGNPALGEKFNQDLARNCFGKK